MDAWRMGLGRTHSRMAPISYDIFLFKCLKINRWVVFTPISGVTTWNPTYNCFWGPILLGRVIFSMFNLPIKLIAKASEKWRSSHVLFYHDTLQAAPCCFLCAVM